MHKLVGIIITTCDDDHHENENDDAYIHGESDTRNHCHLVRGVVVLVVVFGESVPTKRVVSHQWPRTKKTNYDQSITEQKSNLKMNHYIFMNLLVTWFYILFIKMHIFSSYNS